MKIRHVAAVILTASFSLAGWSAASAQNPPAPGGLNVLDFKPGFDDLMTMLVQPRHLKLFYAAQEKNWELAAFQLRELRASFRRSGQTLPMYRTWDVNKSVETMINPAMDRLDKAIAAKDAAMFDKEFAAVTTSCNACHRLMEHAFLVVKVPQAAGPSLYPGQEFAPPR